MTLERQIVFWLATFVIVAFGLWMLSEILLPFVAGMALAYFLDPITNRLERIGIGRVAAALVVISVFVLVFVAMALVLLPVLFNQFGAFVENIPGYIRRVQAVLADPSRPWLQKIIGQGLPTGSQATGELITQGAAWLTTVLGSLWSRSQALLSLFSLIVVTPVVAFYMLCDWNRMIATVDNWVPRPHQETVRQLAREMNAAIEGFVRGQIAVCLILGAFYAIALSLVGLKFGLLIGLVSGLITFIPYVGSMTGLVLSVGVAVAQFWPDWVWVLVVLGIFVFGQFVEGNVLSPKLVGESAGLHPVWLIFALFAFGYLFGFVGLLLAVPLGAVIGVLARFMVRRYLQSPFYTGKEPG